MDDYRIPLENCWRACGYFFKLFLIKSSKIYNLIKLKFLFQFKSIKIQENLFLCCLALSLIPLLSPQKRFLLIGFFYIYKADWILFPARSLSIDFICTEQKKKFSFCDFFDSLFSSHFFCLQFYSIKRKNVLWIFFFVNLMQSEWHTKGGKSINRGLKVEICFFFWTFWQI